MKKKGSATCLFPFGCFLTTGMIPHTGKDFVKTKWQSCEDSVAKWSFSRQG